ncbi:RagB/SusD family nutrient uptake outer membrane protein [Sunxiuqinia elliptica]|uniref:Putative outer membrane starch-binding protein n=1 Tax=Sunxiuqinia elliptica TaxID=655355 RepID=A0A4V3BZ85_9BACT|nr:RagB/SusD family nutrient uptake outer membrane protein [Sunxiuqinia elliptica]TDO05539.1 putative outer membrane starch-binding protein [Sunxiuqinia elliptica]TDO65083.1 putative outer membrane starch-binding protein [Sunxiuqinia elliptica]
MKNKILSIVIIVLSLASCQDDFLQRPSLIQLSEESFWVDADDAVEGVNSIYNAYYQLNNTFTNYGMLDDFSDIAYQTWSTGMTTGQYVAYGSFFSGPWGILYKGIYRANTAIKRIPDISMDESLKSRLMGEAKFLRALFYFKLRDYFGGVPIYDTPMNYDEAYKPRNTVEQVDSFIVQDLTDAIDLLPSGYSSGDAGRATKWAAMSLRGKTYLFGQEWEMAAADFDFVIKNSGRDLHPVYEQLFNFKWEDNSEVIFDAQYIMVEGFGNRCDITYGNRNTKTGGWQRTVPTVKLIDSYEMADGTPFNWDNFETINGEAFDPSNADDWAKEDLVKEIFNNRDPRLQQTVVVPWSTFIGEGGKTLIYKWPQDASDSECFVSNFQAVYAWRKFVHQGDENSQRYNSPNNIPEIRFADVLLMYAEAKNEQSGPDESVYNAINRVRARVSMPPIPEGTKDEVRERIRHERRVEFPGEGLWYSDIRRWKIGVELCNHDVEGFIGNKLRTRGFAEREYLWAIPSSEIDLNPELTQNPGWE